MNKIINNRLVAAGLLLSFSYCSFAHGGKAANLESVDSNNIEGHTLTQAATTVLTDRVHQIARSLEDVGVVHTYNFVSSRGQDVLIATPDIKGFNTSWKVEYRLDGGEWITKTHRAPKILTSQKPGTQIDVRVSAMVGQTDYKLVFGSSPRMNYDLHHEEGLLRVPYGFTTPAFLATQAIKEALLEVTFTDSKGHPLEGGIVEFSLKLPERNDATVKTLVSDASGRAIELLKFEACTGGKAAQYFTHRSNGRNTWATRYKNGTYWATNSLLEELANKPHVYNFGHICKRTLVNWSRN